MSIFNQANTEWLTGKNSLFLGEAPALYDSVNVRHPTLFNLYKQQKQIDWAENEVDLSQSKMDLLTCPDSIRDIMLENIAFQWEADSVAARSLAPLFAPFITNSELWAAISKNAEIEVLHSLTYSEIVRQCVPDPNEVFKRVMYNSYITSRLKPVVDVFEELSIAGAQYLLGQRKNDQELYNIVFLGWIALYCLERLQFAASFAATFAVAEQMIFQGIAKLVQKIMQDEIGCHANVDLYVIKHEITTERGKIAFDSCRDKIIELVNSVYQSELDFAKHLFSDGRSIIGLNESLLKGWIDYNAYHVTTSLFGSSYVIGTSNNPLKYMDNWLDLNKYQNANQEADNVNYSLNTIVDDMSDEIFEY